MYKNYSKHSTDVVENKRLFTKVNYLESQSRRNNLVFYGVDEEQTETWDDTEQKVKKVIEENLNIQDCN